MWCVGIKCRRLARSRAEVHVQRLAAFVEQVLEVNVTTSCARSTLSSYLQETAIRCSWQLLIQE